MYSLFLSNALFISDNGFKFTAAYLRKSLKKIPEFENLGENAICYIYGCQPTTKLN